MAQLDLGPMPTIADIVRKGTGIAAVTWLPTRQQYYRNSVTAQFSPNLVAQDNLIEVKGQIVLGEVRGYAAEQQALRSICLPVPVDKTEGIVEVNTVLSSAAKVPEFQEPEIAKQNYQVVQFKCEKTRRSLFRRMKLA